MDDEDEPRKKSLLRRKAPAEDAGRVSEERILDCIPAGGEYVKISFLIKALNIKDLQEARLLEVKLKQLASDGRLEKTTREGKAYFARKT